jgi:hypothetical protein
MRNFLNLFWGEGEFLTGGCYDDEGAVGIGFEREWIGVDQFGGEFRVI